MIYMHEYNTIIFYILIELLTHLNFTTFSFSVNYTQGKSLLHALRKCDIYALPFVSLRKLKIIEGKGKNKNKINKVICHYPIPFHAFNLFPAHL